MSKNTSYRRMPNSVFKTLDEPGQFSGVAQHIQAQVEEPRFKPDFERLARVPEEIQTIYWLWRFGCEAEGGGMEVFLLQREGYYTPQVAAALKAIGADELLVRLLAGVPLAIATGQAEFLFGGGDTTWFRSIPRNKKFRTLRAVDKGAYPPLYKDLRERCRQFILKHQDVFIDPRK